MLLNMKQVNLKRVQVRLSVWLSLVQGKQILDGEFF